MISIDNLSVEFSARPLFSDVSFVVNDRDRIALMGKNGAGKSTMLKIIAGLQQPTGGTVSVPREATIGYLPQVMILSDGKTVRQEAEGAFAHLHEMEKQLETLNDEMLRRTDYESAEYLDLVERYTHLHERLQMMGGLDYQGELERTLQGLGFQRDDFDRPTSEFSGGWRMRIELAKLLLQHPDVLLLDEPTNHLDIESIQWLEQFLQSRSGAVLMVSHDRAFVNNVTNRTLEISCGKVYDYKVKYDEYLVLRQERREQQLRAYENQQKEIADIKAFIERFRYQATKAVQVQSRIKQLEKIVPIEVDDVDNSALHLKFTCSMRSGDYPVICDAVGKTYGEHNVFHDVNLTIERGEKVAFVGKNGEGKSTLVKCIMGEIPFDGSLKVGHNVQIGYFAQNQAQLLDGEQTVFDTIDRVARGEIRTKIRDILGAFMFGGEASDKKVKVLSGGERTRLAMIKLLLEPVNLLILDEPTNHLDLRSKDVLKEAVRDFDGTVIIVSHDRDFLDGLVDRVYEFGGGVVREFLGSSANTGTPSSAKNMEGVQRSIIWQFVEQFNQRDGMSSRLSAAGSPSAQKSVAAGQKTVSGAQGGASATDAQPKASAGALSYEEQKALARQRKKLEKAVSDAEEKVSQLESAVKILEAQLATPEGATDASLFEKYGKLKEQLSQAEDEWAEAMEAMEQ